MPSYLHRTTHQRLHSVSEDAVDGSWLRIQDWAVVDAIPSRYLVVDDDTPREMNGAEKAAALPAWKVERIRALAAAAEAYGLSHYSASQAAALRDEYSVARTEGRLAAVSYLQPWIDFDRAITTEYRERREAVLAVTEASWGALASAGSLDFTALDSQAPSPPRSLSDARAMGTL